MGEGEPGELMERGIRRGSTKLNQQILTSSGVWFHDCDQIWEGTSKA